MDIITFRVLVGWLFVLWIAKNFKIKTKILIIVLLGKSIMKLYKQLSIIILISILGMISLSALGLKNLYSTMLEGRKHEILSIVNFAISQANHFVNLSKSGEMSSVEAKSKAIEVISKLRNGSKYVWVRDKDARLLVHARTEDIGKIDYGSKMPNGTHNYHQFLKELQNEDFVFVQNDVKKPNVRELIPKINGVTILKEWGWMFGYGVYLDDVHDEFYSSVVNYLVIALSVIIFSILTVFFISRKVYISLGGEPTYATYITKQIADGNLTEQFNINGSEDSLIGSLARMQQSLRKMIENIQSSAGNLSKSANNISSQMMLISSATQNSSDATHSTSAAIQELSVCIENISQNARNTTTSSEETANLANHGKELVGQAAEYITEVSSLVVNASTSIEELQLVSNRIGGIISVIKDIAEQTNLLALNAAIEAARAGEQGRGFSVVADEVRTLASRTANATAEITEMINSVQSDTRTIVLDMRDITPKVSNSVEKSNLAANILEKIYAESYKNLDMIKEVAHSATEQSQTTENVAENIEKLSEMVRSTYLSFEKIETNTNELDALSRKLNNSINYFRI